MKKGHAPALKNWKAKNLDAEADVIIADVKRRCVEDRQWLDGFIPHASTYINRRGWEDAIEPLRDTAVQRGDRHLSAVERVRAANAAANQRERGSGASFKPRANDNFEGTNYTSTPIAHMPKEIREAVEAQLAASHAA